MRRAYYFTANYCPGCHIQWDEVLEPLQDEGYPVEEVDAMKNPRLARRYTVTSIPTLIVTDGSRVVERIKGRVTQGQVIDLLTD